MEIENCRLCAASCDNSITLKDKSVYYHCSNCGYIFVSKSGLPEKEVEKARYLTHENDADDESYLNYIKKSTDLLFKYNSSPESLLDYGCGPAKAMLRLYSDKINLIHSYDPIFHPMEFNSADQYEAIACIEAIEHFYHPYKELEKINSLLKPGGYLLFRTEFQSSLENLENWWYRRDPTHVGFFNSKTWDFIAEKFAWKMLDQEDERYQLFQKY